MGPAKLWPGAPAAPVTLLEGPLGVQQTPAVPHPEPISISHSSMCQPPRIKSTYRSPSSKGFLWLVSEAGGKHKEDSLPGAAPSQGQTGVGGQLPQLPRPSVGTVLGGELSIVSQASPVGFKPRCPQWNPPHNTLCTGFPLFPVSLPQCTRGVSWDHPQIHNLHSCPCPGICFQG